MNCQVRRQCCSHLYERLLDVSDNTTAYRRKYPVRVGRNRRVAFTSASTPNTLDEILEACIADAKVNDSPCNPYLLQTIRNGSTVLVRVEMHRRREETEKPLLSMFSDKEER